MRKLKEGKGGEWEAGEVGEVKVLMQTLWQRTSTGRGRAAGRRMTEPGERQ